MSLFQKIFYKEEDDIGYVNSMYAYSNEMPSRVSRIAFFTIVLLMSVFIIWAFFAQVDEITKGQGKIIPSGKIQKIQSLDGGIIKEILVKEGQVIKKGSPLLQVDTTRFQATLEESLQTYLSLMAVQTRLQAEVDLDLSHKVPKIKFAKKIVEDGSRYDLVEQNLFFSRVTELKSSLRILQNQLDQKIQEQREIESNIQNLSRNLAFIEEQRKTIKKLVRRKIKSKYELLNIEKEYNKTKGDLDTAKLSISRSKLAIKEAQNRLDEKIDQFKSESASELNKVTSDLNKFEAKLVSDVDKVAKTIIKSPVDGIIKQINLNTIGGVIQSGVDIVEIVPITDNLLVEVKIDPKDIAFINPSQKSVIKLTAYDFSIYGGLKGKIRQISADSIVDKNSKDGKSYYRVILETDKNYLERNGQKLPIIPGMIADVDIITGKKTVADFILKPVLKVKQNAFTER